MRETPSAGAASLQDVVCKPNSTSQRCATRIAVAVRRSGADDRHSHWGCLIAGRTVRSSIAPNVTGTSTTRETCAPRRPFRTHPHCSAEEGWQSAHGPTDRAGRDPISRRLLNAASAHQHLQAALGWPPGQHRASTWATSGAAKSPARGVSYSRKTLHLHRLNKRSRIVRSQHSAMPWPPLPDTGACTRSCWKGAPRSPYSSHR